MPISARVATITRLRSSLARRLAVNAAFSLMATLAVAVVVAVTAVFALAQSWQALNFGWPLATAGWSLAGLVLATTWMFWDKARSAQIDSLLCFLILAALSAFQAFRDGTPEARRAGWLFWSASALAVLAKGPVGFLLPLGIALVTLAADRNLRLWRRFAPVSGPCIFVAVIALWMVVATVGGRGEYSVLRAFDEHVAKRAVEVVRPAVIRAHQGLLAARARRQLRTAVAAGIAEGPHPAVAAAYHQQRPQRRAARQIRAGLGQRRRRAERCR